MNPLHDHQVDPVQVNLDRIQCFDRPSPVLRWDLVLTVLPSCTDPVAIIYERSIRGSAEAIGRGPSQTRDIAGGSLPEYRALTSPALKA